MTIALASTAWQNSANANTVTIAPAAGSVITIVSKTSSGAGTPTVTGIVTNGSVALDQRVATYQDATTLEWFTVFDLKNCPSGVTSLTVTYNGGTPGTVYLVVTETTGADTTAPFVVVQHNHQSSPGLTSNAITSGTTTTIGTLPALILGIVANNNSDGDTVAGTGYGTAIMANNDWCVFAKRATTSPQQVTATAATHGNTDEYTTFLIAYAEAGAGGASQVLSPWQQRGAMGVMVAA